MDETIKHGECHCGCGEKTSISDRTDSRRGWEKGLPRKYVHNHDKRKYKIDYEENEAGCWIWQQTIDGGGYGRKFSNGRDYLAHRYYYEKHKGVIPKGLDIDHLCRVPACVNPKHLEAVTTAENIRRGRSTTLKMEDVIDIRKSNESVNYLSKKYNMSQSGIRSILINRRWGI